MMHDDTRLLSVTVEGLGFWSPEKIPDKTPKACRAFAVVPKRFYTPLPTFLFPAFCTRAAEVSDAGPLSVVMW